MKEPVGDILNPANIGAVIAELLPEDAILSDEGITCGLELYTQTMGARKHDWLSITGGSIGQGLPVSLGASIACPDRKVVSFQADGSGMYTVQSLWSMAREEVDVTIVLLNNDSYAILNVELVRLKAGEPTDKTRSMFDLSNPCLDWVSLAKGLGVSAVKVRTVRTIPRTVWTEHAQKGAFFNRGNSIPRHECDFKDRIL